MRGLAKEAGLQHRNMNMNTIQQHNLAKTADRRV